MPNHIFPLSADGYDALDRYLDEGFQGCTDEQIEALAHMDIEEITLDSPSARCMGRYGTTAAVIIRLKAGDGSRHDLLFYPVAAGAMMIKTREDESNDE